jgi:hypothetical protein
MVLHVRVFGCRSTVFRLLDHVGRWICANEVLELLPKNARNNAWAGPKVNTEVSRATMKGKNCLVQSWRIGWAENAVGDSIECAFPVDMLAICSGSSEETWHLREGRHCV